MARKSQSTEPYRILGVATDATAAEIKSAYRRTAREMHPDLDPGNPWAEEEFKRLSAAYQLLSDAKERARYDKGDIDGSGRRAKSANTSAKPKPDQASERKSRGFEGFFKDRAGPDIDGVDVDYHLKVSFLEAARGARKDIKTTHGATLKVNVPAGTIDGQVLRLKGQGMRGFGKGRDGDAMIEVEVEPHPIYKCVGRDIHTDVPVDLDTAVLGGKIQVETIDGMVNVNVPANSNSGGRLRLRGRGLATGGRKSEERGDHYVTMIVTLPDKPDPALAEFIKGRQKN
jgi:DnaJ-class molecular chaperone